MRVDSQAKIDLNIKDKKQDQRIIGLDILKIISCIGITMIHFLGYDNVQINVNPMSINGVLTNIFDILSRTSVNIFLIISGYFLSCNKFRFKRLFMLWGQTLFYSMLFSLIGFVFATKDIVPSDVVKIVLPIISRHYWFATAYIVLYLLSPFINKLIGVLSKKEYTIFILMCAGLFSAWTTFVWFSAGALTGGSTGIVWCVYMYLIGGYLRLHPIESRISFSIPTTILIAFLFAFKLLKTRISFLSNFALTREDSIFSLLLSVSLFLMMSNIRINSGMANRAITVIASATFGVYLIQENCMIREWLWLKVVRAGSMADKWYLYFVFVLVIASLFLLSIVCDKIYKIVFRVLENLFSKVKIKHINKRTG